MPTRGYEVSRLDYHRDIAWVMPVDIRVDNGQ